MKTALTFRLPIVLAFALHPVASLRAQQPSPTPAAPQVQAQPQHKKLDPTKIHKVGRPPLSAQATGTHRLSTAQRSALTGNKPLPANLPAFSAKSADGVTTSVSANPPQGHWFLLYRHADCIPCDRLMGALAASQSPTLKAGSSYVIVVDGAKPGALDKVRDAFPDLSAATWLSDSSRQAWSALKPSGSPVLYAMDGNQVAWKLAGALGNPARTESLASSWLAAPTHAAFIAAAHAAHAASGTATVPSVTPQRPND